MNEVKPGSGGEQPPGKRALAEVRALRKRVEALEFEVQECRQLNKRLAEIADVVAEVLLPAAQRDEHRLEALLADYEKSI
jgi:hypothetical protein